MIIFKKIANMKSSLKLGLLVLLFTLPFTLFSQKNKKNKISEQNQTNFEYLGLSINSKPGDENKLFFDQPQVISLIGCLDCEIKASTIFETDPNKKVYLDTSEFKVEKNKVGVMMNDCLFESSRLHVQKLSGTQFRQMLRSGEEIPEWFAFRSVVEVLRAP